MMTRGEGSDDGSRTSSPEPSPPTFVVSLKEHVELLEGSTVRFELLLDGAPTPSILIYKNDEPLIETDRIRTIFQTRTAFELFMEHVTAEDDGEYKIVAINDLGEASTTGRITVTKDKILFPGLEDVEDQLITINDNLRHQSRSPNLRPHSSSSKGSGERSVSRTSHRSRSKTPLLEMFKDGDSFESSEHFQCQFDNDDRGDTIALVFQRVTPGDDGVYTCVANTSKGGITCSAELTIKGRTRITCPPTVSSSHLIEEKVTVKEGDSAMLEAAINGWPSPTVKWFKDDLELIADERHKFLYDDDETYAMFVKNVEPADSGMYTIKADNELGDVITHATLSVICKPRIKRQLEPIEVYTGCAFKLELDIEANPSPDIVWYKDGEEIIGDQGSRFKFSKQSVDILTTYFLEVDSAELEDSGQYSMFAINPSGEVTSTVSSVAVSVPPKVVWPPTFVRQMNDYESREGDQDIDFTIKVNSKPEAAIRWFYDGREIRESGLFRFEHKNFPNEEHVRQSALWISRVSVDMAGIYSCEAINEEGVAKSSGRLTVNAKPKFTVELYDLNNVVPGSEFILKAAAVGHPDPVLKWFKNGTELVDDGSKIRVSSVQNSITIKNVGEVDAGEYSCRAENIFGHVTSKSFVHVLGKPDLLTRLTDLEVFEGDENIELVVEVKRTPTVKNKVRWFVGDEEIELSDRRYNQVNREDAIKLIIKSTDERTSGRYKVLVSNLYGEVDSVCTLRVNAKPKLISGLKDVLIPRDVELNLKIIATGSPAPDVRWLKNGSQINDNNRISLIVDKVSASYQLVIKSSREDDSGHYVAEISNCFSKVTSEATIKVTGEPRFARQLTDCDAFDGDATCEFVIELEPQPLYAKVNWFFNDEEICEFDSRFRILDEGHVRRLVLKNPSSSDRGRYSCSASNKFGEVRCDSNLTIKSGPKFIEQLTPASRFVLGSDLVLTVKVDGFPKPTVNWYKNGELMVADNQRIEFFHDEIKKFYVLEIKSVTEDDAANYSLRAINQYGSESSSSNVRITSMPFFESELVGKEVLNYDEDVELFVILEDQPLPSKLTWFLDELEITEDDDRFIMIKEGTKFTLIVRSADEGVAGLYKVVVTNTFGTIECSASLIVNSKPEFLQGFEDREVLQDDSLIMDIVLTGHPAPIVKFFRNDIELDLETHQDENVVFERESDLVFIITIKKAELANGGRYSCLASNSIGSTKSSGQLTVLTRPAIVKYSPYVFATLNCPSLMEVTVTGHPRPQVIWFKDGTELKSNNINPRLEKNGNVHRIMFSKVTMEDDADYQIIATNRLGKVASRKMHFIAISEEERLAMAIDLNSVTKLAEINTQVDPVVEEVKPVPPKPVEDLIIEKKVVINESGRQLANGVKKSVSSSFIGTVRGHAISGLGVVAKSGSKLLFSGCSNLVRSVNPSKLFPRRVLDDERFKKAIYGLIALAVLYVIIGLFNSVLSKSVTEQIVMDKVDEYVFKCTSEACKK